MNNKPKIIASIKIDITEDNKFITKEKCENGCEQQFAMLLVSMEQGLMQEYLLKQMTDKAKTQADKEKINLIAVYYNEMVKQVVAKIQEQYDNSLPLVRPTELFSKHLQKYRKRK